MAKTGSRSPLAPIGRALASPLGVIVTLPLLVVAVGIGILLLGRSATQTSSQAMAHHQLGAQVLGVRAELAAALDQADPLLVRLRQLADPARPSDDALIRLHDLLVGRPGIAYLSLSFPDGRFRGAFFTPEHTIRVNESEAGGASRDYTVADGMLVPWSTEPSTYDPRQRGFYRLAEQTQLRSWTPPYTFFKSHETGITCTEPIFDSSGALRAVATVDFDVTAMSRLITRPMLDEARSFVFTGDGTMLASPASAPQPTKDALLRHEDLRDHALDALFAVPRGRDDAVQHLELTTSDGEYLAAIAAIGGRRAEVAAPLDWYVATVVPTSTLLGPTHALERTSILASGGALAVAVALALVLAWNLLRMRRQVAASREEARTAEARARELGSYRLIAKLGHGGMGEVWRAEHRLLARSAAIKLIRAEALHDPNAFEVRERFRREAQTLASMKSRHTIEIYDYGVTAEGTFYYVMELLDGLDLESIVMRYGAQPSARVIRMLIQACSSLAEAHDAGLLHRDIKPPNLFVCRAADEFDITKMLDFGIVQTIHEESLTITLAPAPMATPKLTQLGSMLGTPGFMAPEQILGMQLDGRSDLYSLGCCAWWLLAAGEIYPREGGDAKVLRHHISDPIPALRPRVRGWCPPELEAVIASCLAKEPDQRPRDARALADRLREIAIPDEYVWSDARALAWWSNYTPPAPLPSPTSEVKKIVGHAPGDRVESTILDEPPTVQERKAR